MSAIFPRIKRIIPIVNTPDLSYRPPVFVKADHVMITYIAPPVFIYMEPPQLFNRPARWRRRMMNN